MSISTNQTPVASSVAPSYPSVQTGAASKAPAGLLSAQGAPVQMASKQLEAERTDTDKLSAAQTQTALQEVNKVMDALSISVRFQIDPEDQQMVIKVVDQDSGKVIRQFPSEEVVRISKALDNLKGLLFAQTA